MKLRLFECRDPRELDVWLHSAVRVAKAINPYLAPDDAGAVWLRIAASPCYGTLQDFQRRWLALFRAVALRDAGRMAELGGWLLDDQAGLAAEVRQYVVMAALAGNIASRNPVRALELWRTHGEALGAAAASPAFRLLRCHAAADCAADFRAYAER